MRNQQNGAQAPAPMNQPIAHPNGEPWVTAHTLQEEPLYVAAHSSNADVDFYSALPATSPAPAREASGTNAVGSGSAAGTRGLRVAQPTAIIGVGGTGQKVCTLVKSYFLGAAQRMPENLLTVCFDSANDPVSYPAERTGAPTQLEPGSEFFLFDPVPVLGIKRNPDRHTELFDSLGAHAVNRINRAYISHGAAADRAQGYLALLWNGKLFERTVDAILHRLIERDEDLGNELDTSTTMQVFVVASVAGGQGSGAAQALAHIVGQQLNDLSTLGERGKVIGIFLLPGAFHGIENLQMQANAQAFAEELNALMLGRLTSNVHYAGSDPIRTNEPPFDYVYVFDGVDENGKAWPNLDEVCSLAARLIWLLSSSEVGAKEINAVVNKTGVLLNVSDGGYGTYLATAGQATIRFPARAVVDRCAARQAHAVLAQLLKDVNLDAAPSGRGQPVEGLGLSRLREQLGASDAGAPLQVKIAPPAAFEQMPVEDVPPKAHLLVDSLLRRRVEQEVFTQIVQRKALVTTTLADQLHAALNGLWLAGRLTEALDYLRQNRALCEQALGFLAGELEKLAQLDEQNQAALAGAAAALDKSAEGFLPIFRRGQVRSALAIYINEANTVARQRIERRVAEASGDVLRAALNWLQAHLRLVESAVARMVQGQEWLTAFVADLSQYMGSRTEIALADAPLVDYFFQKHAGQPAVDAPAIMAQLGAIQAWSKLRPQDIGAKMMECVAGSFAPVLTLSVEDVLALRWSERSAQQWISRLETLAAGAWNPDRALLKGGGVELANFLTLGVPDASRSIFGDSGRTLVSTYDPERIVALRTIYGGSFDALKPAAQWQRALARTGDRHLSYIYPHYQPHADQSAVTFALGMIYGQIRNQASWYYYQPADPLREALRLGQGLEKAVTAFRDQRELQIELAARLQTELAHEGNSRAGARIDAWIKQNNAGGDETLARLRRTARDYLAGLGVKG